MLSWSEMRLSHEFVAMWCDCSREGSGRDAGPGAQGSYTRQGNEGLREKQGESCILEQYVGMHRQWVRAGETPRRACEAQVRDKGLSLEAGLWALFLLSEPVEGWLLLAKGNPLRVSRSESLLGLLTWPAWAAVPHSSRLEAV